MAREGLTPTPEIGFSVIDAGDYRKSTAFIVEASLGGATITARKVLQDAVHILRANLDDFGTRLSSGLDYTVLPGENAGEIRVVTSTPAFGMQDTATRLTIEDPQTAETLLREDTKWGHKHEEGEQLPSVAYMRNVNKSQNPQDTSTGAAKTKRKRQKV